MNERKAVSPGAGLTALMFGVCTLTPALADEGPRITTLNRFSLEELRLPKGESMGLLGGNFLFEKRGNYWGLGIYGAVTGRRGGFFTGGFELGRRFCAAPWCLDAGLFVGGGGGGAAPQGGGLMLRPHLDVWRDSGVHGWALGISQVRFPNGAISSWQASVSYQRRFSQFWLAGWPTVASGILSGRAVSRELALQGTAYLPARDHRGRSGKPLDRTMQVIGIRWRQHWRGRWWPGFETAGAWGGAIDGFAQVLGGLDFIQPLGRRWDVLLSARLGAAGGGDVDTGGGVIGRLAGGVQYVLDKAWSLQLEGGQTRAWRGGFTASTLSLAVFHRYHTLAPLGEMRQAHRVRWKAHRVRAGIQSYRFSGYEGRKSPRHVSGPVDMFVLKMDAFANSRFFLTGQALGAYDGGAGGYAVGLVGAGWQVSRADFWYGGEVAVGAAGGGGLDVGDGVLLQALLNLGLMLNKQLGLEGGIGYTVAPEGRLQTATGELSLVYRFAVPQLQQ